MIMKMGNFIFFLLDHEDFVSGSHLCNLIMKYQEF